MYRVGQFGSFTREGGHSSSSTSLTLDVLCPQLGCKCVVTVPRSSTVGELKAEACAELCVVAADVELFDYFGSQLYACLEDSLNRGISEVRLMDRQSLLVKGRNSAMPNLLLPFLECYQKPPDIALRLSDGTLLPTHRWILEMSSSLLTDVLSTLPEQQPGEQPWPEQARAVPAEQDCSTSTSEHTGSAGRGGEGQLGQGMIILPVPDDDRLAWTYILRLLYPAVSCRRPPITWSNLDRILLLADKWNIASVVCVAQEFLLLPSTTFSTAEGEVSNVWRLLVLADRLAMAPVVRKCISTIAASRCTSAAASSPAKPVVQDPGLEVEKVVKEVVACCSKTTLEALTIALLTSKDKLQAEAKATATAGGSGQRQ